MKSTLLLPLISSVLLAGVVETSDGTFLEIYSGKGPHSNIVGTVSTSKGRLTKKLCANTRNDGEWCKVKYTSKEVNITGFVDKKSFDKVRSAPNKRKTFETTFGGRRNDVGKDIIPLRDGALIVGHTQSFGAGNDDAYVIKVDRYGNKISSYAFGGGGDDTLNSVIAIENGFMAVGTTRSFGNGVESIYMTRLSSNGRVEWQNGYYSDKDDYYRGNDLISIGNDNFLVAGSENHVKFFNSETNCYINSIDINGKRNGIRRYGGEDKERANSIVSVPDGYVVSGITDTWGHGGDDAYVVKINKKGDRVWHNAFGFRYDEVANQIIATKDGGFVIVGSTDSDVNNQKDIFLVKMNAKGDRIWKRHYGTKENEEGFGIVEVDDGYVVAGYTNYTPTYNSDAYLLKVDKSGNILWNRRYGGDRDDQALAIVKIRDGFFVTGFTTSSETYSKDVYLLRVDENGKIK